MTLETQKRKYTPAQVSALTGLPLSAVHKAIEYRLIRPQRIREGKGLIRLFSEPQVLFLLLEAKGLRCLPLPARRDIAKALERNPSVDALPISDGGVIVIECKSARRAIKTGLRRLAEAELMVECNADVMFGTPVYRGTRIPVGAIADMLADGAGIQEILDGYPALTREKVELAPLYVKAFPRRGRPPARPWGADEPRRTSRHRLGDS